MNKVENRQTKVMDILKKNFPEQFQPTLTQIWKEYSDISGLETETISTNNFYEQKLRLSGK